MHNFRNLEIWKEGVELAKEVYTLTQAFPQSEIYGLASQMTRAAISVPSNIAEGAGRDSDKDFAHFLSISIGSLFELQTQIIIAKEIGYMSQERSQELLQKVENLQKKVNAFRLKLK